MAPAASCARVSFVAMEAFSLNGWRLSVKAESVFGRFSIKLVVVSFTDSETSLTICLPLLREGVRKYEPRTFT